MNDLQTKQPWYRGITRYQWLVLVIASLGWVFDVFEGQIFVASMNEAMPSLVPDDTPEGGISLYNNIALGAFLLGGALGGIFFGMLSDRIGRVKTMSITILFYSVFTCVSAFSQEWWHLAGLRFLVAMGVGGEWAVASSLVAEVFPKRARAHVGGIFHASSVFGTYLAVAAGTFLIGNTAVHAWALEDSPNWMRNMMDPASIPWRLGFSLGVFPALLIVWIRLSLRETDSWKAAREKTASQSGKKMGSIGELFSQEFIRRTLIGVSLSTVGLATFWGAHIYGKNMYKHAIENDKLVAMGIELDGITKAERKQALEPHQKEIKRYEMRGMFLASTGGGIGLVLFGPLCFRFGRRPTFAFYHIGGLIAALLVFQVITTSAGLLIALPIFGFLTLGMHAGYAIYFPELYPTRLRGTGTGFCFNAGRVIAAPILFLVGWLQKEFGYELADVAAVLSFLFILGIVALPFAPETKGLDLPE